MTIWLVSWSHNFVQAECSVNLTLESTDLPKSKSDGQDDRASCVQVDGPEDSPIQMDRSIPWECVKTGDPRLWMTLDAEHHDNHLDGALNRTRCTCDVSDSLLRPYTLEPVARGAQAAGNVTRKCLQLAKRLFETAIGGLPRGKAISPRRAHLTLFALPFCHPGIFAIELSRCVVACRRCNPQRA